MSAILWLGSVAFYFLYLVSSLMSDRDPDRFDMLMMVVITTLWSIRIAIAEVRNR